MTCYLCKRGYSRLSRHLETKHKLKSIYLEPDNLKEFVMLLKAVPVSNKLQQQLQMYEEDVQNYLNNDVPLPESIQNLFYKSLKRYKHNKMTKLVFNQDWR